MRLADHGRHHSDDRTPDPSPSPDSPDSSPVFEKQVERGNRLADYGRHHRRPAVVIGRRRVAWRPERGTRAHERQHAAQTAIVAFETRWVGE